MAELNRSQPLSRDAMAYVLAGGRGSRLKELTDRRAKPAVHFGGKLGSVQPRPQPARADVDDGFKFYRSGFSARMLNHY